MPAPVVLQVEDQPSELALFQNVLETAGYVLETVENPVQARRVLEAREPPPQSVLFDRELPDEAASELSLPLRSLPERGENFLEIFIRDEGTGFDFRPYLELDPKRMFDPNGRGVSLASRFSI